MRGAGFSTYPIYTIGKKIVKYRQKENVFRCEGQEGIT